MAQVFDVFEGNLVVSGSVGIFKLPFRPRCLITKLLVSQVDGNQVPFEVELYSREAAAHAVESSASASVQDDESGDPLPVSLYLVAPTVEGINGRVVKFWNEGPIGYLNHDDRNAQHAPGMDRKQIYMRITPSTPGDYTYAACLGGKDELL